MSKDNSPSTSACSYNDPERCLFSFRVLNRLLNTACCLTCFCDTGLVYRVQQFEIFITHHISNGPYTPIICTFCKRDIITSRPIALCTHCMHAYTRQLIKLRVDLSKVHFLFDIFNNRFEYFNPNLPQHDRS